MRVQENVLPETAMAWDLKCPSEIWRTCSDPPDVMDAAGVVALARSLCSIVQVRSPSQVDPGS